MIKQLNSFLNSITMYRLVLYGLLFLSGIAILFGFLGVLPFTGLQFLTSFSLIFAIGYLSKLFFKTIFKAETNYESSYITSLILFLILVPPNSLEDTIVTCAVTFVAIASKFVFAVNKKHIFNPAAFAIFLAGLVGFGNGIWWIGSLVMLPFVTVVGLLIVRKLRRFHLFFIFLFVSTLTIVLFNLKNGLMPSQSIIQVFASWPIIFFGTVMLTEPLTMPSRKKLYLIFGGIVGVLFGSQFHFGPIFASPELSLIVGNLFAYIVNPKYKLVLQFKQKNKIAPHIYEFIFSKNGEFRFLPGQYLEWTLPERSADGRGNRRYFTIASSPENKDLLLGVKIDENQSSKFKKTLLSMKKGDTIVASQLSGDFVLPEDTAQNLVFIAGGIGITPFRSMIEHVLHAGEKRNITLFYTASTKEEFVYTDLFQQAEKKGILKIVYIITDKENVPSYWKGEKGYLSIKILHKHANIGEAYLFYISGPNAMVDSYKKLLLSQNVQRTKIMTDYFPGF